MTWTEIVVAIICTAILINLLLPTSGSGRPGKRTQCKNNLKQIMLALYNYHESYGAFPPAYTTDSAGKPLHSWRALILPMLDEQQTYQAIDFSKPWNDPVNLAAFKKAPLPYRCPSFHGQLDQTTYLAVVTETSFLRPGKSCTLSDVTDDHSKTLFILEVPNDKSVHWMSPNDADEEAILSIQTNSRLQHAGCFQGALVDGTTRFISVDIRKKSRLAMITVSGNDDAEVDF